MAHLRGAGARDAPSFPRSPPLFLSTSVPRPRQGRSRHRNPSQTRTVPRESQRGAQCCCELKMVTSPLGPWGASPWDERGRSPAGTPRHMPRGRVPGRLSEEGPSTVGGQRLQQDASAWTWPVLPGTAHPGQNRLPREHLSDSHPLGPAPYELQPR